MMYANKFVAVVKVDGKVLREQNGEVAVPYGAEYSLLLRNLNTVKAQVKVSIDGTDATENWLVIEPNGSLDLQRYVKSNDNNKGNKFKFIERTETIENHRGIKAEDGLVIIEYKFAKPQPPNITNTITTTSVNYDAALWPYNNYPHHNLLRCDYEEQSMFRSFSTQSTFSITQCNAGITVPGGESNQAFMTVPDFECENSEVIILHLVGAINDKPVTKAVTVEQKPQCVTCGKMNKAVNKFCSECGTSLILFR